MRPGDVTDTSGTSQAAQGQDPGSQGGLQPAVSSSLPSSWSLWLFPSLQGSSSPHLQGELSQRCPLGTWPCLCPLGRPIPLPGYREHGAHRELCWAVPGCWGGRRLLLGRGQRQRFQPQRAAVRLCRTTPCPVSHLCGPRPSGSDTPGPLPALPCSCWHEALTQHSSPESPVPAQPKFQRCVRVPRARPAGTEH